MYDYHPSHTLGAGLHAKLETLGVAGHRVLGVLGIRESLRMKDEFRRHGLRCARHRLLRWNDAEALIALAAMRTITETIAIEYG